MPLTTIQTLSDGLRLGLWNITEKVTDLPCPTCLDLSSINSDTRKIERLVTYQLLNALTGLDQVEIKHDKAGKPLIDGYEISLSHTRGWAAMIISEHYQTEIGRAHV